MNPSNPSTTPFSVDVSASPVFPVVLPEATQPESKQPIPPRVVRPKTSRVWNINYAHVDMAQTVQLADEIIQSGQPEYFVTANLNYAMLTEEHPELHEVNAASVAVIADGNPIVWRSRATQTPLPCRVAGSDMISSLAELSAIRGYRIFFLGGQEGVGEAAAQALSERFPSLQIAGCYAPPFRELTGQEHESLIQRIQDAQTDILYVAFGQPKGEKWIFENYQRLGVPLSIQLGASFDFLAGTAKRAPKIWQKFGCEWLFRALCHPRRLFPRYARNFAFLCRASWRELSSTPTTPVASLLKGD